MTWEEAVQWLRQQADQQELVRACYYDDPLLQAAQRFTRSAEWQAVNQLLPSRQGQALDLGAGRGISSYALASAGWQVTALEPDPSPLVGAGAIRALSAEAHLAIDIRQEYGENLPFPDASFDLVYGRQVLHHARDLNLLCREAARVLRPGGSLIATREHVLSRSQDLPAFLNNHPLHALYGGENAFLLSEYQAALRAAGLRSLRSIGPHQSAINYFPLTRQDYLNNLAEALGRRTGPRLARWISQMPMALPLYAGYLTRRDQTPGRMYSFVAVKEGRQHA